MTSSTSSRGMAKSSALRRLTSSARAAEPGPQRLGSEREGLRLTASDARPAGRLEGREMREIVSGEVGREVPLEGERVLR